MLDLTYIVTFAVTLGILVVVHEWGHFVAARIFGIRVDEFSIGFGPRALRIGRLGSTEYNVRWIPLGGYVRIAGMEADEEPLLRAADKVKSLGSGRSEQETPASPEQAGSDAAQHDHTPRDPSQEFYAHPLWQRSLVIFAGPLMSFVFGYLIFFGIVLTIGVPSGPLLTQVAAVQAGSEAQRMGLKPGDRIASIDGKPIITGEQILVMIHADANKLVHLTIRRGSQTLKLAGTPQPTTTPDGKKVGLLGFIPDEAMVRYNLIGSVHEADSLTVEWLDQVGDLIKNHNIRQLRKDAGGPIFIAEMAKQAVKEGGPNVPLLVAQLSMSLAIFNLLPIPILDGGHLLIFAIEALRRGRRLTLEQQQSFMLAGLAVIGVLFVLIMFNDIVRWLHPSAQ